MLTGAMAALTLAAAQQTAPPAATPVQSPSPFVVVTGSPVTANPADVASLDAIMRAVYDVISGPPGAKRDWNRMRSLFTSNARLMPLAANGLRSGTVDDYISSSGPSLERDGFFEQEIARKVEQYGDIAHVFSTYQARRTADGPVFLRGVNSFQLVRHNGRWWVVSIMWQHETPQNRIPTKYLPSTRKRG